MVKCFVVWCMHKRNHLKKTLMVFLKLRIRIIVFGALSSREWNILFCRECQRRVTEESNLTYSHILGGRGEITSTLIHPFD